jgi:hypothetical protein
MATVNLGAIKFNWKGAYSNSTAYAVDDVVSSGGSSYVCIQAHTNQPVGNATAYWNIMSSAGTNGTNGTDLTSTLTTQGDLLYRDGSGLQRLGAGTSGQVLQTGGTGANPSWVDASGGATEILQHTTIDSTGVSSIIYNTDWTSNNFYKISMYLEHKFASTNNANRAKFRMRNASGNINSNDYGMIGLYSHDTDNHTNTASGVEKDLNGRDNIQINGWGASTDEPLNWVKLDLFKPDNSNRQSLEVTYYNNDDSNPDYHAFYHFNGFCRDTSVKTGFQIFSTNDNISHGRLVIIGHKYA